MKFEEALVELMKGKKLIREDRDDLIFYLKGNFDHEDTCFSLNDVLSDKWKIKEESGKTFPEVFEKFKKGKSIRRKSWDEFDSSISIIDDKALYSDDLIATDWEVIE